MLDVIKAKILSETYVLKFPKRGVPLMFSIKIAPKGKAQFSVLSYERHHLT